MAEIGHSTRNTSQVWTYGFLGGLVSLPVTAVSYWRTGSEVSLTPVILGGIAAGYLATRRTGESSGVGVRAGLIGGFPVIWMLFDILTAMSELAGPAWFVTGATLLTIGFIVVFAVVGFGMSALLGEAGAKVGSWLAEKRFNRQINNKQ